MNRGRRAAAAILVGLLLSMSATGCTSKEALAPPPKNYIKWTKVADGEYTFFAMPEYMNAKGLFLQRQGYDGPEGIYHVDLGNGKASLVPSGFDLNREVETAEGLYAKKMEEQNEKTTEGGIYSFATQFLPKRNALLMVEGIGSTGLWLYNIEGGTLGHLSEATSALGIPSPNEHFLAIPTVADADQGAGVNLYSLEDKAEKGLLSSQSPAEDYSVKGWVNDDWLLCTRDNMKIEDGVNRGVLSRDIILVNTEGGQAVLELPEDISPDTYCSLSAGAGIVTAHYGEESQRVVIWNIDGDGTAEVLMDYTSDSGRLINDVKVNERRTGAAYINALSGESIERALRVVNVGDGSERNLAPLKLSADVETSFKDFYWIDENRILVVLREEWEERETSSAWVLDLRAKPDADEGESGGEGNTAEENLERDTAGEKDFAGSRDAALMAEGYLSLLRELYTEGPEMNGAEGELRYLALDTKDMLWVTEQQKAELLLKISDEFNVEVLDKSYVELKAEGYLTEDGRFADGMLFKITGGYMINNIMKADVFKWRSLTEQVSLDGLETRFQDGQWKMVL